MTYQVTAERDGRFWLVHVPAVERYTQARNIPEIEPMARSLIHAMTDEPEAAIEIDVEIKVPQAVTDHRNRARELSEQAAASKAEAALEARLAARALKDAGLTVRDIGTYLDVSFQRAQQLTSA